MYAFNPLESMMTTSVQGKGFLFIDLRVDRKTIPNDLYVYEIADGDGDGCFTRIQPYVMVNFWGTIIGKEPLDLEDGVYYPEYGSMEYEGTYFENMTLEAYRNTSEDDFIPEEAADGECFCRPNGKYTTTLQGMVRKGTKQLDVSLLENIELDTCSVLSIKSIESDDVLSITVDVEFESGENGIRTMEIIDNITSDLNTEVSDLYPDTQVDFWTDEPFASKVA